MHNMMVKKSLEHGDDFGGDSFNNRNDYKTDQDGNVLDEAEEFVHLMELQIYHSQHIDPTTQFLQD